MQMIQILDLSNKTEIRNFELARLEVAISDPMEREMFSWNAPWREESLNHYLATGWAMALWSSDLKQKLLGYFLGQTLLYYQGLTQALWIEYIGAVDQATHNEVLDLAVKCAKDKHLQSVFYNSSNGIQEFKTTKR